VIRADLGFSYSALRKLRASAATPPSPGGQKHFQVDDLLSGPKRSAEIAE